jgi:hypothetical protein
MVDGMLFATQALERAQFWETQDFFYNGNPKWMVAVTESPPNVNKPTVSTAISKT